jgi:hypothetical protein
MIALLIDFPVTLSVLTIQGIAVVVGVRAINALLAKQVVGTDVLRNGVATLVLIMILMAGS